MVQNMNVDSTVVDDSFASPSEEFFQLVHRRDKILAVRDNFKKQYVNYPRNHRFPSCDISVGEILRNLERLDLAKASPNQVREAMGGLNWVAFLCDACGADCDTLLHAGDYPDYEARWLHLCPRCVAAGMALFDVGGEAVHDEAVVLDHSGQESSPTSDHGGEGR